MSDFPKAGDIGPHMETIARLSAKLEVEDGAALYEAISDVLLHVHALGLESGREIERASHVLELLDARDGRELTKKERDALGKFQTDLATRAAPTREISPKGERRLSRKKRRAARRAAVRGK